MKEQNQLIHAEDSPPQPPTKEQPAKDSDFNRWLPTPGNMIFTLLIVSILFWAQNAGALPMRSPTATSTNTISYQGRLADTSGNPLTGEYNIEFRIYNAPTGGSPLWEESWTGGNSVQISDGLFNVMLGSINTTLTNVIAGQNDLYLGITVGTDSEMSPRVQLGSVPYSMQALTVPDGAITTEKIADGAVTQSKLNLDNGLEVSGSTTLDYNQGNIAGQALVVKSGADQLKIQDVGDGDYLMLGHDQNSAYLSDYKAGGEAGASIHLNHNRTINMIGSTTLDYNQGNVAGQALVLKSGADQLKIQDVGDGDYLMLGHDQNSAYLSDYKVGGVAGASIHLNHDGSIMMTGPTTFQTWEQVTATGDISATASCPSGKTILFGWKLHLTDGGRASITDFGSCSAGATSCNINTSQTAGDDEVRIWMVCQ